MWHQVFNINQIVKNFRNIIKKGFGLIKNHKKVD